MNELQLYLELSPLTNARKEQLGGRDYVVADAVILKVQVLNGSDGPLFYPLDEINQDVGVWNGFPVTAKHPFVMQDGKTLNVSARHPKIANEFQVGTVYNDRMVGEERQVEVWFDVANANRIDPRIVPAVLSGQKINVSTGIFTKKREAVANSQHKGKGYTHTVHNIRPDHLAVLMDEKGACSVNDGCGLNVTKNDESTNSTTSEVPNVNKEQLVQWLTTNCDCWKGDKGKTLNTLDEEQLKGLKVNAEGARTLVLVTNGLKTAGIEVSDPTKIADVVKNMTAAEKKKWEADQEEEQKKKMGKVSNNGEVTREQVVNALKGMKDSEVLDLFPSLKTTVNTAATVVEERKVAIIKQLTANISDEAEKKAKILKLKDKDLPTLNEYLEFATLNTATPAPATKTEEEKFLANFFGGGTPAPGQKNAPDVNNRAEVLPPSPVMNFDGDE